MNKWQAQALAQADEQFEAQMMYSRAAAQLNLNSLNSCTNSCTEDAAAQQRNDGRDDESTHLFRQASCTPNGAISAQDSRAHACSSCPTTSPKHPGGSSTTDDNMSDHKCRSFDKAQHLARSSRRTSGTSSLMI